MTGTSLHIAGASHIRVRASKPSHWLSIAAYRTVLLAGLGLVLSACPKDVALQLSQEHAMQMAATLRAEGIHASTHAIKDSFVVRVPKEQRNHAERLIVNRGLFQLAEAPQQATPRSGLDSQAAVRRREDERAAEIATAIRAMPSVYDARVTLTLCESSQRSTHEICHTPNQLSVMLILHPGAEAPNPAELRHWLTKTAPSIEDEDIAVFSTTIQAIAAPPAVEETLPAAKQPAPLGRIVGAGIGLLLVALLAIGHLQRRRRQSPATVHSLTTAG